MDALENNDYKDVVSWTEDGTAFRIDHPELFTQCVLPKFFRKTAKLSSFKRRLLRWGFTRIDSGENRGAYINPLFRRGGGKFLGRLSCRVQQPSKVKRLPNDEILVQKDEIVKTNDVKEEGTKAAALPVITNNKNGSEARSSSSSPLHLLASAAQLKKEQGNDVGRTFSMSQDTIGREQLARCQGMDGFLLEQVALQVERNSIIQRIEKRLLLEKVLATIQQKNLLSGLYSQRQQLDRLAHAMAPPNPFATAFEAGYSNALLTTTTTTTTTGGASPFTAAHGGHQRHNFVKGQRSHVP